MSKRIEGMFVFSVLTEDNIRHDVTAAWAKVRGRVVTFYVNHEKPFVTAHFLKYKSFSIKRRININ
jgi:hypothetical protein